MSRNFDDPVFGACVDVGFVDSDVVKNVAHEGSISGTDFVNDKVVVGVEVKFVIGDEVASESIAIVGFEQFRGGVPNCAEMVRAVFFL